MLLLSTRKLKGVIPEVELPAPTSSGKTCFSELKVILKTILWYVKLFHNYTYRREICSSGKYQGSTGIIINAFINVTYSYLSGVKTKKVKRSTLTMSHSLNWNLMQKSIHSANMKYNGRKELPGTNDYSKNILKILQQLSTKATLLLLQAKSTRNVH